MNTGLAAGLALERESWRAGRRCGAPKPARQQMKER